MRIACALVPIFVALPLLAAGQAAMQPQGTPPTAEEVRKGMGIASQGDVRGQQDAVGFASKPDQIDYSPFLGVGLSWLAWQTFE